VSFTVESGLLGDIGPSFFAKFVELHAAMFQVGILLTVYFSLGYVEYRQ